MKKLTPIILILISIALAVFVINPEYGKAKELDLQKKDNEKLLETARSLEEQRAELKERFESISAKEKDRLSKLLPDTVDNVRLILDIDNIASAKGIKLNNFKVSKNQDEDAESTGVVVSANKTGVGAITLGFDMQTSYPNFKDFMIDLEKSLRVVDVKAINISTLERGTIYDYKVEIDTYWLR